MRFPGLKRRLARGELPFGLLTSVLQLSHDRFLLKVQTYGKKTKKVEKKLIKTIKTQIMGPGCISFRKVQARVFVMSMSCTIRVDA